MNLVCKKCFSFRNLSVFVVVSLLIVCNVTADECTISSGHTFCENLEMPTFKDDLPDSSFIYIYQTNMTKIPDESLKRHTNCESLYILRNQLNFKSLGQKGFKQLTKLTTLDLSFNKFESIRPQLVSGMVNLKILKMNNNKISRIWTNAFVNMTGLVELHLSGNRLESIPQLIGIPLVEKLTLDNNNIKSLTYSFTKMLSLNTLALGNNKLKILNLDSFSRYDTLTSLDLKRNGLDTVPSAIKNFTKLQQLVLEGNPISAFPSDLLTNLPDLRELDISNMRLSRLPRDWLPRLHKANIVDLKGNQWDCGCSIASIAKHYGVFKGFYNLEKTFCANPTQMRTESLVTAIKSYSVEKCGPLTNIKHTYEKPVCSKLCKNGGTCQFSPYQTCRCLKGYTGPSCEKQLNPSAFDLPEPILPGKEGPSSLHINQDSLTESSVYITLPRVYIEYLIQVSKELQDGTYLQEQHYYKVMNSRTYKIEGLNEAGSTYKICICPPKQCKEDQMCNLVTTKVPEVTTTTRNKLDVEKQTEKQYEVEDKVELREAVAREETILDYGSNYNYLDNSYQPAFGVSTHDQERKENNPSVYLAVGAVLSILIIFIVGAVMFVFLRRKKGKLVKNRNPTQRSSVQVRFSRKYSVERNEVAPLHNEAVRNSGSAFYKPPIKGAQRRDPVYQTIDSHSFRRNDQVRHADGSRPGSRVNFNGRSGRSSQLDWSRSSLTRNGHMDPSTLSNEILEYAALPKPSLNELSIESPSSETFSHSFSYAGCNRPALPQQAYKQENNIVYSEQPYSDSRVYTLYGNHRDYEQIIEC